MSNVSNTTRWWENYLVRYFLPSVVGMIILRWLDINSQCAIREYIPVFLLADWKDFDISHLIVWLLFGSLYCYISSYPILVFHATRVLDFKDRAGTMNSILCNPYLHSILFTVIAYLAAWLDNLCMVFFAVILFTFTQLYRLYRVYADQRSFQFKEDFKSSIAYAYLHKLSNRRSVKEEMREIAIDGKNDDRNKNKKTILKHSDLVESYKHLREHGNTAFIFLLELGLCPVLFVGLNHQKNYVDFAYVSVLIVIWIIPSALVHLLGQHLERRYSLFEH